MPKIPTTSPSSRESRRHNPLAEDYAPTGPLKQKTPKKRRSTNPDSNGGAYIDSKASRQILRIGQDLVDEDAVEARKSQPNPAFAFDSRFDDPDDAGEPQYPDDDDADAWGDDPDDTIEEVELDPRDRDIFDRFNPSLDPDPSRIFDPATRDEPEQEQSTNLADLILAKIAEHEATQHDIPIDDENDDLARPASPDAQQDPFELPPKVVEVYTKIGQLLSRQRSGPLPKPFKILPTLPNDQIPLLVSLTAPEQWTPHACYLATRLFISAKPAVAQPFLTSILLPRVRDEIRETRKLHAHLYSALKKALYRPACFFKGILFPLLEDGTCSLREAHIVASIVQRVSVPVLHSAAALLRLCDIAAEQFSTRAEGGGSAATNYFIRVLLEKKYALPYKVVDAVVFHFLRFKALAGVVDTTGDAEMQDTTAQGRRDATANSLTVIWHQGLLAFAQRYRNEITEDQREALLDLINAVGHRQIGPETRRELLEGRGRGVPAEQADLDMADGDDTMVG